MEALVQDQRTEPRKKILIFTPVYLDKPRTLLGYLGNLTVRGMLVVGEKSVETGKDVTLSIEFPPELPEMGGKPFLIAARVARCDQDDSPQYFNIGMEFPAVSSAQKMVLEAMMERYEFRRKVPKQAN